jgi:uncharacterized protein (TIRG00374 family)
MKKRIIRISLVFGALLFAFLVYKAGPSQIFANIKKLTWRSLLVLLGLRLVYWMLRTFNWKMIFECYDRKLSFLHLFGARVADHAVSYLMPSAMMGGGPIRAIMVDGSSKRRSFATVVLDKTIEVFTTAFFIILAVAVAIIRIPMSGTSKSFFTAFAALTLVLCGFLLVKQKRSGLFNWGMDTLARFKIRPKFIGSIRHYLRDIDAHISDFYKNHREKIHWLVILYSLTFLLWTIEIHLTLLFLKAPGITLFKSFLIVALGNVAFLLPTVPASLGVYEITNIGIFALLGMGPGIAMSMVVIRRIISLFWTGVGLLAMLKNQVKL